MITLTDVKQQNNIGVCSFDELSSESPVVLALGMFDGIHAGHRQLLSKAVDLSEKYDAAPTILTFVNHPLEIINPQITPKLINTTREKAVIAASCGIKQMVTLWFDEEFCVLEPEDFIEKYIMQLNVKGIVCGYNYKFGNKGKGDCNFLKNYLEKYGVQVCIQNEFSIDDVSVNSTYIRKLIENGDIKTADRFLQSEYIVGGNVAHGYQRGRTLGFPTANIIPPKEKLLPPNGVYVTKTIIDSDEYISVTNVGSNPTFGNQFGTVETYIEDFNDDVYDKYLIVKFYCKLRDEIKFDSTDELMLQIEKDKKSAIDYFNSDM